MFGINDLEITLYFVGEDEDAAQEGPVFDTENAAIDYRDEEKPGAKVFSARGLIDFTTMKEENV